VFHDIDSTSHEYEVTDETEGDDVFEAGRNCQQKKTGKMGRKGTKFGDGIASKR